MQVVIYVYELNQSSESQCSNSSLIYASGDLCYELNPSLMSQCSNIYLIYASGDLSHELNPGPKSQTIITFSLVPVIISDICTMAYR